MLGITDNSNIAYFGITVTVDEEEHKFIFPPIVASSLDPKDFPKILPSSSTEIITVTDLLTPSDPMLGSASKMAHLKQLFQLISGCKTHSYFTTMGTITPWIDKKITNRFMLSYIGDVSYAAPGAIAPSDKPHIKTCNENLGALLHCEQIMLLKVINTDLYINTAITRALNGVNVNADHPIQSISFDIFTYNDMCPNCFSTCYNFHSKILERINAALATRRVENVNPANFKIFISSVRPYTISSGKYTRDPYKRDIYEFILSKPLHGVLSEQTAETKVIQFFNKWTYVDTIIEDLRSEIETVKSLTFAPDIVALLNDIQTKVAGKRTKLTTHDQLLTMITACGKQAEITGMLGQIETAITQKKAEMRTIAQQIVTALTPDPE